MTPRNDVQDEKLDELKDKAKANQDRIIWLEQHWSVFNNEMGEVRNNVRWLIKIQWWQIGVMVAGFGALLSLFLNHISK